MIEHCYMGGIKKDKPITLTAENQSWDEETLKQLKEEYNIVFMTRGDGVYPIMILNSSIGRFFVIGNEDDGTMYFDFDENHGRYRHMVSPYWVDAFMADLKEAMRLCGYKSNF